MLKYRLIFGLLFAALLAGVFYLDSHLSAGWWTRQPWVAPPGAMVLLMMAAFAPVALREMQGLLAKENVRISMRICVVASLLCMVWPWFEQVGDEVSDHPRTLAAATTASRPHEHNTTWDFASHGFKTMRPAYLVPTVMAASLMGAFFMHTRKQRVDGAMANAGGTLLAIVYLGVLPGFYLPICLTHGAWMVLGIIGTVKAADVGAYITGLSIGRHKLILWLSPGKTVEGFFGGLVFAGVTGALVALGCKEFAWYFGAAAGVVLGAVGQLGDLVESLLKRDAGVKDSGRVPGFGGVLDMFDSPLLAAPVAYWMLKLLPSAVGGTL